jgi:predicted dehydrogenase/nucleoside-diphosphate-sugar epimerase
MLSSHKKTQFPKIAFAGCGKISHVHMHFLSKLGYSVSAVCDSSETRARAFAEQYGIKAFFQSLSEMLARIVPDSLHILTPPNTHYAIALEGLKAGCHLLVEKPLCLLSTEANDIMTRARDHGLKVRVDHTRVFNPLIKRAQSEVESGRYGKIVRMEYDYDDPGLTFVAGRPAYSKSVPAWMRSLQGGIFTDLLPHPISLFLRFDPDVRLEDVHSRVNDAGINEDLLVLLSSPKCQALVKLSLNSKPLRNALRIYCERGAIEIDLRNFFSIHLPERRLPNIVARITNTISIIQQMTFGFIKSTVGILTGRIHPYSGLDEVIRRFYSSIDEMDDGLETPEDLLKIVSLLEDILDKIDSRRVAPFSSFDTEHEAFKSRLCKDADYLVTGGTGFIGQRLVERLISNGKTVRVLCRGTGQVELLPHQTAIALGDMRNQGSVLKALAGVHTVYHCAAAMAGDYADFYESNVLGTANLLQAIRHSNVRTLIYVSSLSVLDYISMPNYTTIDENSPLEAHPERRGCYSQTKKLAEDLVRQFSEQEPRIKIIIIRPGLVYGLASNNILSNAGVRIGRYLLVFGSGERQLGLNYVDNLVEALIIAEGAKGSVASLYHVVDPDQPTVSEYINRYNSLTPDNIIPIFIPVFVWQLAFGFLDFLTLTLNRRRGNYSYRLASLTRIYQYTSALIESDLHWNPPFTNTEAMNTLTIT